MSKQLTQYSRWEKSRLSADFPEVPEWIVGLFEASEGKTVAVACNSSKTDGGILLTDNITEARAPDVATVVACKGTPYKEGDNVAFAYGYATRVKDFSIGGHTLKHELRFYGCYGESMDNSTNETTSAPRVVTPDEYALMVYKDEEWRPLPGKVALVVPEADVKIGSLFVPDDAQRDPLTAIVYSVAEETDDFKSNFVPGQEVVYHAPAAVSVGERHLVIREEYVFNVVK